MNIQKISDEIDNILHLNEIRNKRINATFNPYTGEGSIGERKHIIIHDFPIVEQWLPTSMLSISLVQKLIKYGSIEKVLTVVFKTEYNNTDRLKIIDQFIRIRCQHDFAFWAAMFVKIKKKGGGDDVFFRLTYPQRILVEKFELCRLNNEPIRIILLKARQWGGSTTSQLYMAWLQLIHKVGLNSLIIAHQGAGSDEIKDMFDRMIKNYPIEMLHNIGDTFPPNEQKMVGVGKSGAIFRVPQRNCKIKIGSAERPDSCRGGDYNLVHLSEVGVWRKTDGKSPEEIVGSACTGIQLKPYTMIVYESTAKGVGNFFHNEYLAAKNGQSLFKPVFISWFDINWNVKHFRNDTERKQFATKLYTNRNNPNIESSREDSGKYLWWLWSLGATLEAINWYVDERSSKPSHEIMASECPSDDIEAFVNSGANVFDRYQVENLRHSCRAPRFIGDVYALGDDGEDALKDLRFKEDAQGQLAIWSMPEIPRKDDIEYVTDRYLTVVDVGGRSNKADWSVIVVFDRLFMLEVGGKPSVVAQWYGHIDIDKLAWKAAQVAAFYDNSLLVIESNTLETHDRERYVDGDQSGFILNQIKNIYPNLYARKQSVDEIRQGLPRKYGFHTNVATKPMIISTLIKCVRDQLYIERDSRCLDEYIIYERRPNGSYGAIIGKHDDLLMTRAIGLHICFYEMDMPTVQPIANISTSAGANNILSEASI